MKILSVIFLILSTVWFIAQPGYESVLAIISSITTLAYTFIKEKMTAQLNQQHQSVSKSSIGIQAGGNVNISVKDGDQNVK